MMNPLNPDPLFIPEYDDNISDRPSMFWAWLGCAIGAAIIIAAIILVR